MKKRGSKRGLLKSLVASLTLVFSLGLMAVFAGVTTEGSILSPLVSFLNTSQGACSAEGFIIQNSSPFTPIECELGTIPAGGSVTIEVGYLPNMAGPLHNTATVRGGETDPNPDDNTTTIVTQVTPLVDLSITKTASPDPVSAGRVLTYSLTVANMGPSVATNVTVVDDLPDGVEFVSVETGQGTCSFANSQVVCNLGEMPAMSTAGIAVQVQALTPGLVTNIATVASGEPDSDRSNNTVSLVTRINAPVVDLLVNKRANPDPVGVGELLTYTITVINNGPDDATNVVLDDLVDASRTD